MAQPCPSCGGDLEPSPTGTHARCRDCPALFVVADDTLTPIGERVPVEAGARALFEVELGFPGRPVPRGRRLRPQGSDSVRRILVAGFLVLCAIGFAFMVRMAAG